ncbi:MAG: DUF2946 family protein [Alphaproteobacteria bacterium]
MSRDHVIWRVMRSALLNRPLIYLLGALLLLKAAMPLGFMPDMAALRQGIVKITICSAYGAQQIYVDQDLNKTDPKKDGGEHQAEKHFQFCPFEKASSFAPPAMAALFAVPFLFLYFKRRHEPDSRLRHEHVTAAWPRAPPLRS